MPRSQDAKLPTRLRCRFSLGSKRLRASGLASAGEDPTIRGSLMSIAEAGFPSRLEFPGISIFAIDCLKPILCKRNHMHLVRENT